MTSVVRVAVIRSCRTRRLRHAVAKSAKGDATKTAVAVTVVARYAIPYRTAVSTVTATRAMMAALMTAAAVVGISHDNIPTRIAANALPSAVPKTATETRTCRVRRIDRIRRIDCIYRRKAAATAAVTRINTRIPNVTHSISVILSCVFEETSYYIIRACA